MSAASKPGKWPRVFGNRLDDLPPACFVCRYPEWEGREDRVAVGDMCNTHRKAGAALLAPKPTHQGATYEQQSRIPDTRQPSGWWLGVRGDE